MLAVMGIWSTKSSTVKLPIDVSHSAVGFFTAAVASARVRSGVAEDAMHREKEEIARVRSGVAEDAMHREKEEQVLSRRAQSIAIVCSR